MLLGFGFITFIEDDGVKITMNEIRKEINESSESRGSRHSQTMPQTILYKFITLNMQYVALYILEILDPQATTNPTNIRK